MLHGQFPYVGVILEESDKHREPKFKAEMLAKFGRETGIDPSVAWPTKDQVSLDFWILLRSRQSQLMNSTTVNDDMKHKKKKEVLFYYTLLENGFDLHFQATDHFLLCRAVN